jgi:Uma2 family endonuclease
MNAALRHARTVSDYLAWAEAQDEGPRTELINGQIVAVGAESVGHVRTKGNVLAALHDAVNKAGIKGEVFAGGLMVPIEEYTAYDPDALVRCGARLSPDAMKVDDPLIVAEVVSPWSVHTDTSPKLMGYFRLASVRHYLIVDPDARMVLHHARTPGGGISRQDLSAGTLRLDPPGLTLDVAALFG